MNAAPRRDWTHDLVLPTLLFAALGAMGWAVRGCTGYGAAAGCVFAGVMWGSAWWFISRDVPGQPSRRYRSAWIVLAVTVGFGFAGARGWMQWASFFEEKLYTNYGAGEFVPISRGYGFLWLFLAGIPWAGLGACLLAWCNSLRDTRLPHWLARLGFGLVGGAALVWAYRQFPQWFLPLYSSLEDRYRDLEHNPNLRRLINDCGEAMLHLGVYIGFLVYEIIRRDTKNAVLIATVGLLNGVGWSLCQNWKWAARLWPDAQFNWWRCWETSGGISIGLALGVAYFLVNRPVSVAEQQALATRQGVRTGSGAWLVLFVLLSALGGLLLVETSEQWGLPYGPILIVFSLLYYWRANGAVAVATTHSREAVVDPLEPLGLYLGVLLGLGLSLQRGLKGFCNLYLGNQSYWDVLTLDVLTPVYVVLLVWICARALGWTPSPGLPTHRFDRAASWLALVLIVQNVLAQLVTGPHRHWNETAFSLYYLLLLGIATSIVLHYADRAARVDEPMPAKP